MGDRKNNRSVKTSTTDSKHFLPEELKDDNREGQPRLTPVDMENDR